jgi:hypothetical protein
MVNIKSISLKEQTTFDVLHGNKLHSRLWIYEQTGLKRTVVYNVLQDLRRKRMK